MNTGISHLPTGAKWALSIQYHRDILLVLHERTPGSQALLGKQAFPLASIVSVYYICIYTIYIYIHIHIYIYIYICGRNGNPPLSPGPPPSSKKLKNRRKKLTNRRRNMVF